MYSSLFCRINYNQTEVYCRHIYILVLLASSEPPAPPIPDRNFDDDEEEEEEEEVQDANTEADVSQDLTDDTVSYFELFYRIGSTRSASAVTFLL